MRIIVVGAGPAGLVLAHALPKAGIDDFVILERREDISEPAGAGITILPHTLRIFDQLGNGLLQRLLKESPKMTRLMRLDAGGGLILTNDLFTQIEEKSVWAIT
jgi:2-polyprenyl-6-methoxyphenol hydroxylase-like FAD-dependent oxidoreductase